MPFLTVVQLQTGNAQQIVFGKWGNMVIGDAEFTGLDRSSWSRYSPQLVKRSSVASEQGRLGSQVIRFGARSLQQQPTVDNDDNLKGLEP